MAPWPIAADVLVQATPTKDMVASTDLASILRAGGGEVWVYVGSRRVSIEDVADGTFLIVGRVVG